MYIYIYTGVCIYIHVDDASRYMCTYLSIYTYICICIHMHICKICIYITYTSYKIPVILCCSDANNRDTFLGQRNSDGPYAKCK